MPKPFLHKNGSGSIYTWRNIVSMPLRESVVFPKIISLKVNVIVRRLELELVYYPVVIQHVRHYARGTALSYWNTD